MKEKERMNNQLSIIDAAKLYLWSRDMSEEEVKKKSRLHFGKRGFYFGKQLLNDNAATNFAMMCKIPKDLFCDRTMKNLRRHGMLDRCRDRVYFCILKSDLKLEQAALQAECDYGKFVNFMDGQRMLSPEQMQNLAKAFNVDFTFLQNDPMDGTDMHQNDSFNDAAFELVLKKQGKERRDVPDAPEAGCTKIMHGKKMQIAKELQIGAYVFNPDVTLQILSDEWLLKNMGDRIFYLMRKRGQRILDVSVGTGIPYEQLRSCMHGNRTQLSAVDLSKLAAYFGTTMGFLRYGILSDRKDVFWYYLIELMAEHDMSEKDAAAAAGIEESRIYGIADGTVNPKPGEIEKLAACFDVPVVSFPREQLHPDGTFEKLQPVLQESCNAYSTTKALPQGKGQKDVPSNNADNRTTNNANIIGKEAMHMEEVNEIIDTIWNRSTEDWASLNDGLTALQALRCQDDGWKKDVMTKASKLSDDDLQDLMNRINSMLRLKSGKAA